MKNFLIWGVLAISLGACVGKQEKAAGKDIESRLLDSVHGNICQSCAMPLTDERLLGTNEDQSKNQDYCIYCYKDGVFTTGLTMDEMISQCADMIDEVNQNLEQPITREEYTRYLKRLIPTLKRWKQTPIREERDSIRIN